MAAKDLYNIERKKEMQCGCIYNFGIFEIEKFVKFKIISLKSKFKIINLKKKKGLLFNCSSK